MVGASASRGTLERAPFEPDAAGATLDHLARNLGPSVLQVLVAPRGLDVTLGDPIICDPLEEPSIEANAIVLAVGTRTDSTEARELIAQAGRAGAAVVVFKLRGHDCEWVAEAEESGIALLAVADGMGWSHLNALLALTIPSLRQSTSIPGMASVPIGDLFALANAIAGIVGGAVTIEDAHARVLAYSNLEGQTIDEPRQRSILGRQVPDTPGLRALYKRLWSSDSVIRVDTVEDLDDMLPRITAPIRVDTQTLGSIWVVEGKTPFGKEAERALAEAARVAALHMIHARSSSDIERRMRGDLLRSLLEGHGNVDATATRLGIDPNSPMVVLAFALSEVGTVEHELYRERLVDLVATYSDAFRLSAACVAIGKTVYVLLPVARELGRDRVMRIAMEMHEHSESTVEAPVRTAVSSPVADLRAVPSACHEVDRILRVLAADPREGAIASIDDVRSRVTLLALRELAASHPDLAKGKVEAIAEHDARKGSSYLETLRAYVDAFGDIPAAASRIDVHPNTFRYRIRRLVELFDLALDDPDERLVLELQLRLIDHELQKPPDE